MPDGAHNFKTDTVYFHLPSLKKPGETVFGVACFEQIDAQVRIFVKIICVLFHFLL